MVANCTFGIGMCNLARDVSQLRPPRFLCMDPREITDKVKNFFGFGDKDKEKGDGEEETAEDEKAAGEEGADATKPEGEGQQEEAEKKTEEEGKAGEDADAAKQDNATAAGAVFLSLAVVSTSA